MKVPAVPPAGYVNINQKHISKKMRVHLFVTITSKDIIVIQMSVESFPEGLRLSLRLA